MVRYRPPRGDWSAAGRRDSHRGRRRGGRAVVHLHLRRCRARHSGAPRPASPTGDSRALQLHAEPDVDRRGAGPGRRGALLRVVAASGLYGSLLSRNSPLRGMVRGADSATNFRAGARAEPGVGDDGPSRERAGQQPAQPGRRFNQAGRDQLRLTRRRTAGGSNIFQMRYE